MKSDGTPIRNFIGISDIVRAINVAITENKMCGVFNLSGLNTNSISWLAHQYLIKFKELTGKEGIVLNNYDQIIESGLIKVKPYNISQEQLRAIGFTPKDSIMDDIGDSLELCLKGNF
jgi:nucleoside-diphosphate-sugar epimerase